MTIEYRDEVPEAQAYWALFQTTGWQAKYPATPQALHTAARNSWACQCACDGEALVGFGRVVTDGVLYAAIYDLIVLPAYRSQGIGSEILRRLVSRCQEAGIREIQLFCARGKLDFYRKRGFVPRPEDAPGMRYQP